MKRLTLKLKREYKLAAVALILLFLGLGFIVYVSEDRTEVIANQPRSIGDVAAMYASGQKEEAIRLAEAMLLKSPTDLTIQTKLATFYFQSAKYDQFLSFVEQQKLESGNVYNMMAKTYQTKGDIARAKEYYVKAIESDPKFSQYYLNYSAYLQSIDDKESALSYILNGLEENPRSTTLLIAAASLSLKLGNKDRARDFSLRALEIDPENTQAKSILESY